MKYLVNGISKVEDWYGNKGFINMDQFEVENIKDIPNNLNDGGFGVKNINGAWVRVQKIYEEDEGIMLGTEKVYQISRTGKIYPKNNPAYWPEYLFRIGF